MTRQRLVVLLVVLVGVGGFLIYWTCGSRDRAAIEALLNDVRAAAEAGDLEPALAAFRRDFVFDGGAGESAVLTYDDLVQHANRELARIEVDEIEVRNVQLRIMNDHAEVELVLRFHGEQAVYAPRAMPLRLELERSEHEDPNLYRGWRLAHGEFRRLTDN